MFAFKWYGQRKLEAPLQFLSCVSWWWLKSVAANHPNKMLWRHGKVAGKRLGSCHCFVNISTCLLFAIKLVSLLSRQRRLFNEQNLNSVFMACLKPAIRACKSLKLTFIPRRAEGRWTGLGDRGVCVKWIQPVKTNLSHNRKSARRTTSTVTGDGFCLNFFYLFFDT